MGKTAEDAPFALISCMVRHLIKGERSNMSPYSDFNLLIVLDALLSEQSVAGAARKLGLSSSAMSRALGRLRNTTKDPLLVRAGRKMVLTPYAKSICERAHSAVLEVNTLLQPVQQDFDAKKLTKTFLIRSNAGFIELFAAELIAKVAHSAPGVRLIFLPKPEKNTRPLREGEVDLEIGVAGEMGPEIRLQTLFRDHFIGVVHCNHTLAQKQTVTPKQYCAYGHVVASRHGKAQGPVDEALSKIGLQREITAVVPSFAAALKVALHSNMIALIPYSFFTGIVRHQEIANRYHAFDLPVQTSGITISQMWHPRLQADPAHRWFRKIMLNVCKTQIG